MSLGDVVRSGEYVPSGIHQNLPENRALWKIKVF